MTHSVRVKRGVKANLPKSLPLGELAFCTDTRELFVGVGEGYSLKKVVDQDVLKVQKNLISQVEQIATKGTTVEVIERITKEEIEKQIEDGRMATITIGDKTLDSSKIKDKSLDFALLNEDIQNKTKELHEYCEDIPHTDAYVTAVGQIQQIADYSYKKYPVKEGETIYITTNCVGSTGALAVFLNKNNGFVSNHRVVADVGARYYIDEPVEVPQNAHYVLIHTKYKAFYPIVVKKYSFLDILNFKQNTERNVNNISTKFTKPINIIEGDDVPYTVGFMTSGGSIQSQFTGYKFKIIPVIPNTNYYVTTQCKKNAGALACFFDRQKNRLGNYKPNSDLSSDVYNYIDEKVVTPEDCYYMGICTTNSEETPVILKMESTTEISLKEMDKSVLDLKSRLTDKVLQEAYTEIPHTDGFVTHYGGIQLIGNYYYKKIPLKEGETIYVTTNCVGSSGALAVFRNADDRFISNYKVVSEVGAKYYVDEPITAPKGCDHVLIHTRTKEEYPIIVKKNVQVVFSYREFFNFKNHVDQALNDTNSLYDKTYGELIYDNKQLEERIVGYEKLLEFDWKPFDKAYVIVCIDDGRHDLCKFLEIFKEFNMPLSCALMTSNLNSIQDDGRKLVDVALDIQANGGEVLSHSTSGAVFTETTTEEDANERLRTSKKILTEKGLVINGFVKPGGTGALARLDKFEHLMRKYYRYGYSAGYSTAYSPFRYDMRGSFENLKTKVDNAIKNKSKITFYSHSFDNDEVTEVTLRALLTYIKNTDGVELVTTKYLYDNFATNTLENRLRALENK